MNASVEIDQYFLKAVLPALESWISEGKIPQQAFKWDNRKGAWQSALAEHRSFLAQLPRTVDRALVRNLVAAASCTYEEKLLSVMLWGFAGIGYGPHRTKQMLQSANLTPALREIEMLSLTDSYLDAYRVLEKSKIRQLGPSYSSKLLSFMFSEVPGTPILDSVIANHLQRNNVHAFAKGAKAIETWNPGLYDFYVEQMRLVSARHGVSALDLELAIYEYSE